MKVTGHGILPISGKTLFKVSNTSTTKQNNVHTLLEQQTGERLPIQSFDPFLKSQECQELHTSYSNDCSVKKHSNHPTEGCNLVEGSEAVEIGRQGLLHLKPYQDDST